MRRTQILAGVTIAVFALVGAAAYLLTRIDPNDYVGVLEAKVQDKTGRRLSIDGRIGYTLSLRPTVAADGVRFQNASWGRRPDMLTAKRIEVQIALLPLVRGNVEVVGFTLIEPDLPLEVDASGRKNWDFQAAKDAGTTPDASSHELPPLMLRKGRVEDGQITYRDAKASTDTRLKIVQLAVTGSGERLEIKGRAEFNDVPIEIAASTASTGAPGASGASGKSAIALSGQGFRLNAEGVLPLGAQALDRTNLQLVAEVADWRAVAKLAAIEPPRLPILKLDAHIRASRSEILIDPIKATLGKSMLAGSAQIPLQGKPAPLAIRIESPFVDLAELLGPAPPRKPSPDGRIFSAEPLGLDAVRSINAKADVRIEKLDLRDGRALDNVQASITAANGRIVAAPVRLGIEGRELRLSANADASSGKTLALNLTVEGQGIALGALGAMLGVTGTPEGSPTDINLRFAGHGASVRGLMATANADVRMVIGAGRIKNRAIDFGADITELLNALNPARKSDPYTDIRCAVIRMPIRHGVAQIENSIAAETSKVHMIAAGVIDLRNETLDLGFRTKAATGLGVGLGGLAQLARLRGSLAQPSAELDMGNTASTVAQLGLAAATGGLSLLAGGLLSERVPDQPCNAALTGIARAKPNAPADQSPVRGLLDGIKNLFSR